ncbi:hypothetical protein PN462_16385 [Spirulina sp. CS-785/01]|uniref:hypothetical protein n=1 Tax=Spirulina sp. CS-785/01 TaxID=3021716 RepID=UPI00232D7AD4|nr:hypothetical protein [Spirulina sp. CS-785/01]MDB9314692.1 hypothetical protein [Spirulina sp. CS-785/01]
MQQSRISLVNVNGSLDQRRSQHWRSRCVDRLSVVDGTANGRLFVHKLPCHLILSPGNRRKRISLVYQMLLRI